MTSAGLDGLKVKSNGNKPLYVDFLGFSFGPINANKAEEFETPGKEDLQSRLICFMQFKGQAKLKDILLPLAATLSSRLAPST